MPLRYLTPSGLLGSTALAQLLIKQSVPKTLLSSSIACVFCAPLVYFILPGSLFQVFLFLLLSSLGLSILWFGLYTKLQKLSLHATKESLRFKRLFEQSNDTILIFNAQGEIQTVNHRACELFHYTRKEFIGMKLNQLYPAENQGELEATLNVLLDKGYCRLETRLLKKDASTLFVDFSARCIDKKDPQIHTIIRDISERKLAEESVKKAQAQLLQADKLASIGQLAAGMAHEINNPLAFVSGNTATMSEYLKEMLELLLLYEKGSSSDIVIKKNEIGMDVIQRELKGLIDETNEGLQRIQEIVKSLKNFSRVDRPGQWEEINLNDAVNTTLLMAKNEIKHIAKAELQLGEIPGLNCNPGEISQVLLNLIVNAAHALAEQNQEKQNKTGLLKISTYYEAPWVCCSVQDNGPGINKEVMRHIFEPFFTTKAPGKGTGLGLSISYDLIVNRHSGDLQIESEPGQGACFTFKIPINMQPKSHESHSWARLDVNEKLKRQRVS